jgi:pilus assembly protein FimV
MNEKFDGTSERTLARRCAGLALTFGLLAPMAASPLGLGDITLHSVLNQPLDAGIELTALGQTQGGDITVKLASPAAFESAGLDRSLLLTTLAFTVETNATGTPYIKVTSPDAVREPFLDFLVEIDWPSGHLLREYTLLLDPPVLVDEEPAPVAAAVAGAPAAVAEEAADAGAPAVVAADNSDKEAVPAVQPHAGGPAATVSTAGGVLSYGPVQRSDTLWAIASQLQGSDGSASVEQIMMALLKANPEAFYNGNINELKAGYVLRVADPALLTALSQAAAVAEVSRQNEQWMDAKRARAGMAGAAPQGATGEAMAGNATASGGDSGPRLRLSVPPDAGNGDAEGAAEETGTAAAPGSELARLKQELAAAMESSAASRQENAELRERLAALQGQIDEMQRLATLKDDTLAALQAGAADKSAAGAAATVAPGSEQAKSATPAEKPAAARKPASVPAHEKPAGGLLDDPRILAIAAGAGVLLISLIWLVMRRRRAADAFEEDLAGGAAPAWATAVQTQTADTDMDVAPASQAAGAAAEAETEESGLDLMQADDDEIDVLAEADVYLAYRRFDKAEELLREAIKSEPGRSDLALKLLEVQAASGNQAAFVEQAESFRRSFGTDATSWDKVVVMGRRIAPEHALFGGGAAVPAGRDPQAGLGEDFSAHLELDADIAAELDSLGRGDAAPAPQAAAETDGLENTASTAAPMLDMDLSLDENGLAGLAGIPMDGLVDGKSPEADGQSARTFGSASNVIDFEARTGQAQAGADPQGGETPAGGPGRDLDWLTGVGEDFGSLENADAAEDDFSSLISGEDEVGTKLDLAKAYIDMGDQDSARNILSEVAEEGTQDQQREASELMRQIG